MNGIFWIEGSPHAPLAIVIRPQGDDLLEDELLRLKQSGIETLVSMMEDWEADSLGLAASSPGRLGCNFSIFRFPIHGYPLMLPPSVPSQPGWPAV
jgi:hypothetical protein